MSKPAIEKSPNWDKLSKMGEMEVGQYAKNGGWPFDEGFPKNIDKNGLYDLILSNGQRILARINLTAHRSGEIFWVEVRSNTKHIQDRVAAWKTCESEEEVFPVEDAGYFGAANLPTWDSKYPNAKIFLGDNCAVIVKSAGLKKDGSNKLVLYEMEQILSQILNGNVEIKVTPH